MVDQVKVAAAEEATFEQSLRRNLQRTVKTFSLLPLAEPSALGAVYGLGAKPSVLPARRSSSFI